jgi:hypothetical protein
LRAQSAKNPNKRHKCTRTTYRQCDGEVPLQRVYVRVQRFFARGGADDGGVDLSVTAR